MPAMAALYHKLLCPTFHIKQFFPPPHGCRSFLFSFMRFQCSEMTTRKRYSRTFISSNFLDIFGSHNFTATISSQIFFPVSV